MSIKLHPEKGLNPVLIQCPECGKSTGIALLGANSYVWRCEECQQFFFGSKRARKCQICGSHNIVFVQEYDLKSITSVCDECLEKKNSPF